MAAAACLTRCDSSLAKPLSSYGPSTSSEARFCPVVSGGRSSGPAALRRRHRSDRAAAAGAVCGVSSFADPSGRGGGGGALKRQPLPILTGDQVMRRMRTGVHDNARENYLAFFSSELGGITNEPAFMTVPIDDHMVHRGHGVFDTCVLSDGHLYQLEDHLDRLMRSRDKAGIAPFWQRRVLRNIIHDVAASGGVQNGFIRYWMTAGTGGFGLGSSECIRPGFYCLLCKHSKPTYFAPDQAELGFSMWQLMTTSVEIKPPPMATIKTNNYLPNALSQDEATADTHASHSIFVDKDGFVSEGGNFNVAFIMPDMEFVVPTFDNCLAGCTIQRMMELIPRFSKLKDLRVVQRKITAVEAKGAMEVLAVSSTNPAVPVLGWDRTVFTNGVPGEYTRYLRRMMIDDMKADPPHELHTEVDYGLMTYMQ